MQKAHTGFSVISDNEATEFCSVAQTFKKKSSK